jgi:hypothetical protein
MAGISEDEELDFSGEHPASQATHRTNSSERFTA